MASTTYDDTSTSIAYAGNWTTRDDTDPAAWYDGAFHVCTAETVAAQCSAAISFTGTNISVQGNWIPGRGLYYCYLDNATPWQWYNNSSPVQAHGNLCGVANITDGPHILNFGAVDPTPLRSANGNKNGIVLDAYNITQSPAGPSPVWTSAEDSVAPPDGYANTTSVASSPTSSATKSVSTSTSSTHHTSTAAAVGGGIGGGVGGGIIVALLLWWWLRRRHAFSTDRSKSSTASEMTEYTGGAVGQGSSWRGSQGATPPSVDPFTTPPRERWVHVPEVQQADDVGSEWGSARVPSSLAASGLANPGSFRER